MADTRNSGIQTKLRRLRLVYPASPSRPFVTVKPPHGRRRDRYGRQTQIRGLSRLLLQADTWRSFPAPRVVGDRQRLRVCGVREKFRRLDATAVCDECCILRATLGQKWGIGCRGLWTSAGGSGGAIVLTGLSSTVISGVEASTSTSAVLRSLRARSHTGQRPRTVTGPASFLPPRRNPNLAAFEFRAGPAAAGAAQFHA